MARPYSYSVEAAFASNPDDAPTLQTWTNISPYVDVQAGIKIARGRTDEFGEVQPSKLALTLDNRDGRFTPENTASPYYPNVKSGKKIRVGLLWPGNGKNLYSSATFNGTSSLPGDTSFEGTAGFGFQGDLIAPTITQSSTQARTGTKSMRLAWATGLGRAYRYMRGLIPGRTYTVSLYVFAPTGSANPTLTAPAGAGGSTTAVKDAWTRLAVTFVAPAYTTSLPFLTVQATGTAGTFCYVDDLQIEEGGAATAFEITGAVWSWRFTGDVAEWPLAWKGGPALYAESNLSAADRLNKLDQLGEFQSFLKEDVLDDFPIAYYPLDDPAGSTSAGDISGNTQPPLTIGQVGSGGTLTFGWDHTDGATDYAVPDWYRDVSTGVRFVPSLLGTPISGGYPTGKLLQSTLNAPVTTTTGATIAGYGYYPSAGASDFGPVFFLTSADGSYLGIHRSVFGGMTAIMVNKADGLDGYPWEVTVGTTAGYNAVYQWAAVLSVPSAGNGLLTFVQNGVAVGTAGPFTMTAQPRWTQVKVGGRDKTVDGVGRVNVSHVQVYDYALATSVFTTQWYAAFQGRGTAAAGDTTSFRMSKLLQFRGLAGGSPVVTFNVQGTGPDLVGPQEIDGGPLDAMHVVEDTEGGLLFVNGAGEFTFQLRNYRYNAAAALTLAADRLDPDALTFRGDDFGVRNDVTASRPDGASIRYVNTASIADSGRRKSTVTAIPQNDDDLRSIAARQANGFGTQRNRISGVRISLLNDQALVPAALAVDIGSKLALTGLPVQAPASSKQVYVEGWDEVIGEQEWSISFNTSPAEPWNVWQLGVAGRSELGVTTIVAF